MPRFDVRQAFAVCWTPVVPGKPALELGWMGLNSYSVIYLCGDPKQIA
jgi:hypothetical protein